jgi:hypothetical protein
MITEQVLGIVYRVISLYLIKKEGYSKKGRPHGRGNVDLQMTAQGTFLPLIVNLPASAFLDSTLIH